MVSNNSYEYTDRNATLGDIVMAWHCVVVVQGVLDTGWPPFVNASKSWTMGPW